MLRSLLILLRPLLSVLLPLVLRRTFNNSSVTSFSMKSVSVLSRCIRFLVSSIISKRCSMDESEQNGVIVNDPVIWAMLYANIVGFQYHPSNPVRNRMSLADCAKVADDAYLQYYLRKTEGIPWQP